MGSAAEFEGVAQKALVFGSLERVGERHSDRDDADRLRVGFAEHGPYSAYLCRGLFVAYLGVLSKKT